MTASTVPLMKRPAWKALEAHYLRMREVHLRTLFAEDPQPSSGPSCTSRSVLPAGSRSWSTART